MPTVLRLWGYRFHFYSHEPNEPPHIHVDKGERSAKIWLDPVAVARNHGYRGTELGVILGVVQEHQRMMLEAWHGYFS